MTRFITDDWIALNDGTSICAPLNDNIAWRLRYQQESISATDKLLLAAIFDSYHNLIFGCTQKQRNAVSEEIKNFIGCNLKETIT
jgi:hypothetical protein